MKKSWLRFLSLVPIYIEFSKREMGRLGLARVVGNSSEKIDVTIPLPKKPSKITINAMNDVLTRD